MAVFFDSAGVGANNSNGNAVTWQHVVSGSATALVVGLSFYGVDYTSVTRSVRIGTKALASLGITYNYTTLGWTELFGIINPPTGVQIVAANTSLSGRITANSVSYIGVKSISPAVTTRGNAMPASVTVTSTTASMAVAAFGAAYSNTMTLNPTGTLRWNTASGIPSMALEDINGTGSSVTLGINAANMAWGAVAANLVAAVIVPQNVLATAVLPVTAQPTATISQNLHASAALLAGPVASASASVVGLQAVESTPLVVTASAVAAMKATDWFLNSVSLNATMRGMASTDTNAATATVVPTPIPTPPAHSPLNYFGRYPDTLSAVVNRKYAVLSNSDTAATIDYITQALNAKRQYLVTTAYVDQEDAKRVLKTTVTTADQNYFPATGHGLAVTDSTGFLPASAIPSSGLVTDRVTQYYGATVNLSSDTRVTTTSPTELLLATVIVPAQGYAWVPVIFAGVKGYDRVGAAPYRWVGTGPADATGQLVANNTGVLTIIGSDGATYGSGRCTSSSKDVYSLVLPAARGGSSPTPISGGLTLRLYGSHHTGGGRTGEGYTFSNSGLVFYVIAMPAA